MPNNNLKQKTAILFATLMASFNGLAQRNEQIDKSNWNIIENAPKNETERKKQEAVLKSTFLQAASKTTWGQQLGIEWLTNRISDDKISLYTAGDFNLLEKMTGGGSNQPNALGEGIDLISISDVRPAEVTMGIGLHEISHSIVRDEGYSNRVFTEGLAVIMEKDLSSAIKNNPIGAKTIQYRYAEQIMRNVIKTCGEENFWNLVKQTDKNGYINQKKLAELFEKKSNGIKYHELMAVANTRFRTNFKDDIKNVDFFYENDIKFAESTLPKALKKSPKTEYDNYIKKYIDMTNGLEIFDWALSDDLKEMKSFSKKASAIEKYVRKKAYDKLGIFPETKLKNDIAYTFLNECRNLYAELIPNITDKKLKEAIIKKEKEYKKAKVLFDLFPNTKKNAENEIRSRLHSIHNVNTTTTRQPQMTLRKKIP